MSTIKDVCEAFMAQRILWDLTGCMAEWAQKVTDSFHDVGRLIREERGISPEEAAKLPLDTPLGPRAEEAFQAVCNILEEASQRREKLEQQEG